MGDSYQAYLTGLSSVATVGLLDSKLQVIGTVADVQAAVKAHPDEKALFGFPSA